MREPRQREAKQVVQSDAAEQGLYPDILTLDSVLGQEWTLFLCEQEALVQAAAHSLLPSFALGTLWPFLFSSLKQRGNIYGCPTATPRGQKSVRTRA